MIECKYTTYCRALDFVLDRLEFKKMIVKNHLYKIDHWEQSTDQLIKSLKIIAWWNQKWLRINN